MSRKDIPVDLEPIRVMIHAYLRQCCDAERRRGAEELEGWEARFLANHAVEELSQAYRRAVAARNERYSDPPPMTSIGFRERAATRVIVEVPPNRDSPDSLPFPFFTTRIAVVKSERGWLIESVSQPCIGCNLQGNSQEARGDARIPGKCFLCRGSGQVIGGTKQQGWFFKRSQTTQSVCFACHGAGNCDQCSKQPAPGWIRIASLTGIRDVASPTATAS